MLSSGVTRALIGGVYIIIIYSCSARRISFEMNLISKKIRRAEHEYMNIHTPINASYTTGAQFQLYCNIVAEYGEFCSLLPLQLIPKCRCNRHFSLL